MPDVKEVLAIFGRSVRLGPDQLELQRRRQDRKRRRQRVEAVILVAAVIAILVGALTLARPKAAGPAGTPTGTPPPSPQVQIGIENQQPVTIALNGTVLSRITGVPSDAEGLNLAPDGRTIVFEATHLGHPQIGTIGVDGSGLRFLTHFPHAPGQPSWSPDGSQIAFVTSTSRAGVPQLKAERSDHVFVMNADGSGLRRLTSSADSPGSDQWPTFSPDGSEVAYTNSGAAPLDENPVSPTEEIWSVPVGGGRPTRLTHDSIPEAMPTYSPDGATIAFFRDGAIWTMNADGTNPRPVQGPTGRCFTPSWSPDGSKLAYLTYDPVGRAAVMVPGDQPGLPSSLPLLTIHVVDVTTGAVTTVPGVVASEFNGVSWLPSSDALLINEVRERNR